MDWNRLVIHLNSFKEVAVLYSKGSFDENLLCNYLFLTRYLFIICVEVLKISEIVFVWHGNIYYFVNFDH